jgi:GAF domain-containing protein
MSETNAWAAHGPEGPESDPMSRELLQSIVEVARAIFGAQASSVFLLDEKEHELVFQAVAGAGERSLVGRRFPADRGIAGWVVATGESMVVDDLTHNSSFDREYAESTEYVPDALMAVPLVHGEHVLGVLEVLDPVPQSRSDLAELDLLALFGRQAAAALRVVLDRHEARREAARITAPPPEPVLAGADRDAALQLMGQLRHLLDS